MAIREPSGWVLDVAAGSCAAAAIFLAAYPFAILDHYRIEIGAKRSGDRVKGEPLERVIVAAAFILAAVTFGSINRRSNMAWELPQTTLMLSTSLSALAAIFSGTCAFLSYKLARKIQDELKTDERIVAGVPIHPNLSVRAHSVAVIQCTLFNKSKRKTYLNSVSAYDRRDANIDVTWSDKIDQLGNPQNPCQLVGIVDSSSLFVRMNNGNEIDYARLEISHSFSKAPMTVIFDPLATWATN